MDSFMKAAKSGLAKTVAAGQQQIQQRLAKQSQSQSQSQMQVYSGGDLHSPVQHQYGQQSHTQHENHSPDQYHYSHQTPTVKHSQYQPPLQGSNVQQSQHHYHEHSLSPSQGQHQYQPPLGHSSFGNGNATSPPPGQSYCAASPHGQGQCASFASRPPPSRLSRKPVGIGRSSCAQGLVTGGSTTKHCQPGGHGANSLDQSLSTSNYSHPPGSTYGSALPTSATYSPFSVPPQTTWNSPPPSSGPSNDSPALLSQQSPGISAYTSAANSFPAGSSYVRSPPITSALHSQTEQGPNYGSTSRKSIVSQSWNAREEGNNSSQSASNPASDPSPSITRYPQASQSRNDLAGLVDNLGNLNLNKERPQAQCQPEKAVIDSTTRKQLPHELPPIKADGKSRDIVRQCPEDRVVEYPLYWYQLPEEPEFLVCTKCHQDHVESTSLASQFERILAGPETRSTCDFWMPRVKYCLWKQALLTGDLSELLSFAKRRSTMPNCKGQALVTGKEGYKWFGLVNDEIPGFIVCETCYEDKVVGTSFESRFTPYRTQGAEETWSCDAALPYITRAIEQLSGGNNWSEFVSNATRRMQFPLCEGKDIAWNEGTWFTLRRTIENFHVCGACYMDKLELTSFEHEFEPVNTQLGFDTWMNMLGTRWTCKLSNSNIPLAFALDNKLNEKDFEGFWSLASTIDKLVPCTANGIIGGNWWTLLGGCSDFSICEACYNGVFKSSKIERFLEPAKRNPEDTIVCNFCPSSPRFNQYLTKFAEAMDHSVMSYYTDYVRKFAHVPICPRLDHRENSTWWGYDQALFCQECYITFVAETRLGGHLQYYNASDKRAQICQIWSPRMREMWLELCNAGPPGSAESNGELEKFKAFGERRCLIFCKTIPRIKYIQSMKHLKMMQAMHQGQLSLMYSGMNSMAVLSETTDGHLHGNNSLGWDETEHGATGAQMFDNMQAGFANAARGDEWMQIFELQRMWCEVE